MKHWLKEHIHAGHQTLCRDYTMGKNTCLSNIISYYVNFSVYRYMWIKFLEQCSKHGSLHGVTFNQIQYYMDIMGMCVLHAVTVTNIDGLVTLYA